MKLLLASIIIAMASACSPVQPAVPTCHTLLQQRHYLTTVSPGIQRITITQSYLHHLCPTATENES